MTTTIETWMPEARAQAAQCWCDEETKDREMDGALAEAIARRIAAWMDTAAMYCRNAAYWEGRARVREAVSDDATPAPSNKA